MQPPPGGWGLQGPPSGYGPPPSNRGYPPSQGYGYGPPPAPVMAPYPPPAVWTCPFCRYQGLPRDSYKVSTGGWIVFVVLALFCITLPFCWIGLLIKDRTVLCPACSTPVGRGG